MFALFFVVAFGSSLDVAAIQADSPDPLDYNSELRTVGKYILFCHRWPLSATVDRPTDLCCTVTQQHM